jgi:hypothetical protein
MTRQPLTFYLGTGSVRSANAAVADLWPMFERWVPSQSDGELILSTAAWHFV